MDNRSVIGRNLKKWRKTAGLTQHELAKLTGISQSMIGTVESGKRSGFGYINLIKLADALGITVDTLIREE